MGVSRRPARCAAPVEQLPLAANLGDDADTTAAIAGHLAGAIHGLAGIPTDWLDGLAWRGRLEDTARRLFAAGA